jgi:hypothetical protein
MVAEGEQDMGESKDIDDPGANRADTKKVRATDKGGAGKEPSLKNVTRPPIFDKKKNADWDESEHPRGDDGKFGEGGGSGGGDKTPKDHKQEIADLLEEAEKADDSNNHHKAEALREKARKLEKESKGEKKSPAVLKIRGVAITDMTLSKLQLAALKAFPSSPIQKEIQKEIRKRIEKGEKTWHPGDKKKNEKISNPGKVDEALWAKAKEASQKRFGKMKWPFVTYLYKKLGGTFH